MPYVTGGSGPLLPKAQVRLLDDDHDIIGGSWNKQYSVFSTELPNLILGWHFQFVGNVKQK